MPQCKGYDTRMGLWRARRLRSCTNNSLHETILPGMDTCRSTRFSGLSLVRANSNTHTFRHKSYTTDPWHSHAQHDTSPLEGNKGNPGPLLMCHTPGHGLHPSTTQLSPTMRLGQHPLGRLRSNPSVTGAATQLRPPDLGSRTKLA